MHVECVQLICSNYSYKGFTVFNWSERTLMLVTDSISGACRSRMAVRYITCLAFIIDNYVTRLVLKHRILVFKLDFKLDLLQMALNFILLQDSCIRPIQVRSREIILFKTSLITKNETDSYIPIFLVFLTVRKFLSYINTGPDDFIYGPWEKKTSDKQNNALGLSSNTPSYIIV